VPSRPRPSGDSPAGLFRRRVRPFGFAAGLLTFGLVAALSARRLERVKSDAALVDHTRDVLAHLMAAKLQIGAAESGRRGYVITGDRSARGRYDSAQDAIERERAALRDLTRDNPRQQSDLEVLGEQLAQWRQVLADGVAEFDRNGFSRAEQATLIDRARAAQVPLERTLDRLEERENTLLDARQTAARSQAHATEAVVLSGSAFGFLLLAGAMVSTMREAAARREAERGVRASEERLSLLVEGVKDHAIIMLDREGRIVAWPEGAQRLKGYSAEEAIGRPHTIFYPPEAVREGVPEELLESARLEGRAENEGWRVRKDGTRFWADVVVTALESDGEIVGFAKVTRDMTARRAADERIAALNDDLRQRAAELASANAELETFCYSVSHDLRSPLRAIDGFSQALLEDADLLLDTPSRRHLDRIRAAAARMGDLIDALLELSRVARQPLERRNVNLSALAGSVADELRRGEPHRKVVFAIDPDVAAEGDGRLLRLVLQNLFGNAWKFTASRTPGTIAFGAERNGEVVYFVRDDGVGFDMRYADQLFLPFHRLHGATEFPGTGIGLATVARIVQRHGGRIWAKGAVGEGATFYFTL